MNELRPLTWDNYIGQTRAKNNLKVIVDKWLTVKPFALDHILLCGPAGCGKTSLVRLIAKESGNTLALEIIGSRVTSAELDKFMRAHQWSGSGDILFIDEIHALPIKLEEMLYQAMEDNVWGDLRVMPFTVIGATTKEGYLSKPLHDRFTIIETLDLYAVDELRQIVKESAKILKLNLSVEAEEEIAKRSRGTPRLANQLLKRVANYSNNNAISLDVARNALNSIGIDPNGLDRLDKEILRVMATTFNGPVGLDSLASAVGEDIATLEVLREPYLLKAGFIVRGPRGRELTSKGRELIR